MDFEYGPIPETRYEEVIQLLRNNFPDEPLNVSVGLCKHGKACEPLEHHDLLTLKDGLSVMAIDKRNGNIAGVALNGVARRNEVEIARQDLQEKRDNREYQLIFGLLFDVNYQLDLFSKYNVNEIFELRILCVDSRYRGKGLAKELFMRSEIIAEEYGFKILKVDATSLFTQKIAENFGLRTEKSVCYRDYKDEKGNPLYQTESPHDFYKVMLKELSPKSHTG